MREPLAIAFQHDGIEFVQQPHYPVLFRTVKVDAKTIDRITAVEIGQMLNYLRVTGLKLALILNFKIPKLEFRRVAL